MVMQPGRHPMPDHEYNHRAAMSSSDGKRKLRPGLLRSMLSAAPALILGLALTSAHAEAIVGAKEICMRKGTYSMAGGGTTIFSRDKTCFSPPVTTPWPWEKKAARTQLGAPDPFTHVRIVRYDYHDARYQCAKRHLRLPTIGELKALFAYANTGDTAVTGNRYAIVAPEGDGRYPGGRHGWGGDSPYWSHTFAGHGKHEVIDLGNGRVSTHHDSFRNYVTCVR